MRDVNNCRPCYAVGHPSTYYKVIKSSGWKSDIKNKLTHPGFLGADLTHPVPFPKRECAVQRILQPLRTRLQGLGGGAEREKDKSAQVGLSKQSIKMLGPAKHKHEGRIDSVS